MERQAEHYESLLSQKDKRIEELTNLLKQYQQKA